MKMSFEFKLILNAILINDFINSKIEFQLVSHNSQVTNEVVSADRVPLYYLKKKVTPSVVCHQTTDKLS